MVPPPTIRLARGIDAPALAVGMRSVIEEGDYLATQRSTSVSDLEGRFAEAIAQGHLVLVGDHGGRIVGCAGLHPSSVDGVWSLGTWVLPGHRRQGLARSLIEELVRQAREIDIRKVELEAFSDNHAALALYRACGFEVEGERRDHYRREDGRLRSTVMMASFP